MTNPGKHVYYHVMMLTPDLTILESHSKNPDNNQFFKVFF